LEVSLGELVVFVVVALLFPSGDMEELRCFEMEGFLFNIDVPPPPPLLLSRDSRLANTDDCVGVMDGKAESARRGEDAVDDPFEVERGPMMSDSLGFTDEDRMGLGFELGLDGKVKEGAKSAGAEVG
jgi:hypothetical protein